MSDENLVNLEDLEASFRLPEKIDTRTSLRYWARVTQTITSDLRFINEWEAVNDLGLIQDWKCEYFPDPTVPIETINDNRVANLIMRVVVEIWVRMSEMRRISKN